MHTRSFLRGSLGATLMLGVLSWSNGLEAQFVHLTVEVETTFWDCRAPSVNTKTWTTECVVGTNGWLIRGDPFGSLVSPATATLSLKVSASSNQPMGTRAGRRAKRICFWHRATFPGWRFVRGHS
jgi:hypothetical protein